MKLREYFKQLLLHRGIVLSRPPGQFNVLSIKLQQLKKRGAKIDTVIDGGAANGDWSRAFVEVYPGATCLLIEPRSDVRATLDSLQRDDKRLIHVPVLVGASEGVVSLHIAEDRSSILPSADGCETGIVERAPMTTIDRLVVQHKFSKVDLIKLDLQGAELEALRGATQTLQSTQFVLLEVSLLPFQTGQPLVGEIMEFMSKHGYVLYDISALWHRPLDGALAQGDFLFIRNNHPLRNDARWHGNSADTTELG